MQPLADDFMTLFASPDPERVFCFSPGLARCANGRLIATLDVGVTDTSLMEGPRIACLGEGKKIVGWQNRVFTSDDRGRTWTHWATLPLLHARPFVAGDALYVLGHADDLSIVRSDDNGETWGEPTRLTNGERWHQAPANAHYANGCVYLVMEQQVYPVKTWRPFALAPILMRGRVGDDLTRRENWTFASPLAFCDAVAGLDLDGLGIPFYPTVPNGDVVLAEGRMSPLGWLETNVIHFSTNCVDWCFAGIVALGPPPKQSRHYASMVVDGSDLLVLSRSCDAHAATPHNSNLITFHTVRDFRALVY